MSPPPILAIVPPEPSTVPLPVTTNWPPAPVFLRKTPVVVPPPLTSTCSRVMFERTPSMLIARPVVALMKLFAPLIVSEPAPIVVLVALIPVPDVVSRSSVPSEKVTLAPVPPVLVKVMPVSEPVLIVMLPVKSILPPRIVGQADAAAADGGGDRAGEGDRAAAVAGNVDDLVAARGLR